MSKVNWVFSFGENRRKGIVVIYLYSYLFYGNEFIILLKCNSFFVIRSVYAGKTTRFVRYQVVIFFIFFIVGGFQVRFVGEDSQRRIFCICQGVVGVLKVVVRLTRGDDQNGVDAGGSSGYSVAVGIIALRIIEGLIKLDNAVVAFFFICGFFIEEADYFVGLGGQQ